MTEKSCPGHFVNLAIGLLNAQMVDLETYERKGGREERDRDWRLEGRR